MPKNTPETEAINAIKLRKKVDSKTWIIIRNGMTTPKTTRINPTGIRNLGLILIVKPARDKMIGFELNLSRFSDIAHTFNHF